MVLFSPYLGNKGPCRNNPSEGPAMKKRALMLRYPAQGPGLLGDKETIHHNARSDGGVPTLIPLTRRRVWGHRQDRYDQREAEADKTMSNEQIMRVRRRKVCFQELWARH